MRIERIVLHLLRIPLTVPYKLSFGPVLNFDTIVAELHAGGATGLGEATLLTGYTDETIEGAWALVNTLAPSMTCQDLAAADSVLAPHFAASPFAATALHTAVEMLAGAPLLKVSEPTAVPLLGLINATDPTRIEREIESQIAEGYRTLKVKVGFDCEADAARVRFIQKCIGGRVAIRIDANQGYARDDACAFAAQLDPTGIELFEQPCTAHDWDAAVAVAHVSAVPMMLDESIYGLADIRRAAELKAARFVKLKLMKLGGLERLAHALDAIREHDMIPVLGNGVAGEIGCWMEACVARCTIDNAGEMNGFRKPAASLLVAPLHFGSGAIQLEPRYLPRLDADALARVTLAKREYF
jgi:L-alanine-DL-glutamate epimerase-like enolase superfamily enzyme